MITVEKKVAFGKGRRARTRKEETPCRVPRVARLMALAIRFDQLIRNGVVADQAELARIGRVSRARLTQIMNLLSLSPDIQEAILLLRPTTHGRDRITERTMRQIVVVIDWQEQHQKWSSVVAAEN